MNWHTVGGIIMARPLLEGTPTVPPTPRTVSGPGLWLQVFVVAAIVGIVFTAWFLLRGYGKSDRDGS
jgi:hypothetical protein